MGVGPAWDQWGGGRRRATRRKMLRQLAQAFTRAAATPATAGKRKRQPRAERLPELSTWARFMRRPGISDPTHRNGKLFRQRFRVPYPVYRKLLAALQELPDFADAPDAIGRPGTPLYLKVLASLRVLGRGECFDTCDELSDIAAPTLNAFFHRFIDWLHRQYDVWVRFPATETEIERVLQQYATLGFPGCVGSIDCCHVHWDRCPAAETNENTGKEGYPTRSFEVAPHRPPNPVLSSVLIGGVLCS